MAMLELQKDKGLEPTKTWQRPIPEQSDSVANTATNLTFDLPRDHFIHEILVSFRKDTDATLTDTMATVQVVGNGNKYLKDLIGGMVVNIQRMEGQRHVTGIYHLFFSCPSVPEARPLPAWVFTSLQLKILTVAGGAGVKNVVNVTVVESAYKGEDLSDWKVLVEKFLAYRKYGANTGWQEYEHERAYRIYSYLYVEDDNGTVGTNVAYLTLLKLVARKPDGELTIVGEVRRDSIVAENNARLKENLDAGYFFLQWANGFPSTEFSMLKSYLYIATAMTNFGMRVVERYTL